MSNPHAIGLSQAELSALFAQDLKTGVGRSVKHDSADKHVSGEAQYIDDRLEFPNQLHVYARLSDRAHARIIRIDTAPCCALPVRRVITHEDIPGLKDIGPLLPGDPLWPSIPWSLSGSRYWRWPPATWTPPARRQWRP